MSRSLAFGLTEFLRGMMRCALAFLLVFSFVNQECHADLAIETAEEISVIASGSSEDPLDDDDSGDSDEDNDQASIDGADESLEDERHVFHPYSPLCGSAYAGDFRLSGFRRGEPFPPPQTA